MRATISRCLHALKQRRSSDEGFSLIELIVVVAILGILVAIAIPVFGNIQQTAEQNAVSAAAANGAVAVSAAIADTDAASTPESAITAGTTSGITLSATPADPTSVDQVCVTATSKKDTTLWAKSGPKCTGAANSWTPAGGGATTPPVGG